VVAGFNDAMPPIGPLNGPAHSPATFRFAFGDILAFIPSLCQINPGWKQQPQVTVHREPAIVSVAKDSSASMFAFQE
jgi:hypothetical protein